MIKTIFGKKGFTLIEVVVVLVIATIVGFLIFGKISDIVTDTKQVVIEQKYERKNTIGDYE